MWVRALGNCLVCIVQKSDKWVALAPDPAMAQRMRESIAKGELPPSCEVRVGTVEGASVLELSSKSLHRL